jgi:hypothetical protein
VILVLAWRLSKESLRNGHLHTTRILPGCPDGTRYGDGLKRRDRQSLFDPQSACALIGSARTPPPAFLFLQTTLSKSKPAGIDQTTRFSFRRPSRRKRGFTPGYPRQASCQSGDRCPLVARQYMARETTVTNLNTGGCQPRIRELYAFPLRASELYRRKSADFANKAIYRGVCGLGRSGTEQALSVAAQP